jgi:dipeptidyl aminopeptidase/acylaminoacyl peptidase
MNYNINRSVSASLEGVFLLLVTFSFAYQPAFSKEAADKKTYDSRFDSLWSRNTYISSLSNDGKWVILTEAFDTKEGTFQLVNVGDARCVMKGEDNFMAFTNDSDWFGSISPDNELKICNLRDLSSRTWSGITSYIFSPKSDYFAAEKSNTEDGNSLLVGNIKGTSDFEIKGQGEYRWHPEVGILAASLSDSSGSQVILYNTVTNSSKVLINNTASKFSRLQWAYSGKALIFLEDAGTKHQVHYYSMSDSTLSTFTTNINNLYPGSEVIIKEVSVSEDGATVFLFCVKKYDFRKIDTVEIWDTDKPWIYPRLKKLYDFQRPLYLVAWDARAGKLFKITDEETPDARYNPNSPNTLVYDRLVYEPQYKQDTDVDLFIRNYITGEKHLISRKQYLYRGFVKQSPTGRYTAFFKENDWWVYDSENQNTVNLTNGLCLHFEVIDDDPKIDKEPYGNPGWSENEEFIILYDRYDIWLMTPDGSNKHRITHGREQQIQYRISLELVREDRAFKKSLAVPGSFVFRIKDGLILEMTGDDLKSGYALQKDHNNPETLVYSPGKVEEALMSSDRTQIVFKRSRYNESPAVYALNMISKETKLVYQSNEKLQAFDMGKDVSVNYQRGRKGSVSGALLYPAQFDPKRRYPMIVWIYEKNSRLVNSFSPPSDYEYAGFNILRYITSGYFVLLPDIEYTIGDPGISALRSVKGLVISAMKEKSIDKNRIGLIGHSFGGYEAAFIATQTEMFRAVVAGSAITDPVSLYHDIQGNGWDTEQMWRFENHQSRMGGSYYDHKKHYLKNSPLFNVEDLKTPLLLWIGKQDYNVNWYQGIYLFMAMKRLGKDGKLLVFNEEGHSMIDPGNKKRLSEEVFGWFNSYLKEGRSE